MTALDPHAISVAPPTRRRPGQGHRPLGLLELVGFVLCLGLLAAAPLAGQPDQTGAAEQHQDGDDHGEQKEMPPLVEALAAVSGLQEASGAVRDVRNP